MARREQKGDKKPKKTTGYQGNKPNQSRIFKGAKPDFGTKKPGSNLPKFSDEVRLNKFIANAGVCSRREADELIANGIVTVNGKVVTELGSKVNPKTDKVQFGDETLKLEKTYYVLLNKPKDFTTSMDDPFSRRTVRQLIKTATKVPIYPVGRLDRSTTGVLLFTNDADLSKKLVHPAFKCRKIFHVSLDKPLSFTQLKELQEGIDLGDGFIKPYSAQYVGKGENLREIGIELHSNKNSVIPRIFEHFNNKVVKLDRVSYAGLTKKDLSRGQYRHLTEKEVSFLKMLQ